MDKTRTIGQKWLANELDLHFLTLKVNSFKSYRANKLKSTDRQTNRQTDRQTDIQTYRHTDTQTDTFAKTIFSGSEGLKTWTFDKNGGEGGCHILHKSNTFSDENVKINRNFLSKFLF